MATKKQHFFVKGMTCAACARNVENILKFLDGVDAAEVNYASHQVQVAFSDQISFSQLQAEVQSIGYDLVENRSRADQQNEFAAALKEIKKKLVVAVIFSLPVFLLSMVFTNVSHSNFIMLVLSVPVIFYSGGHFYISAVKKLRHLQFNMDTLIALGTGAAFLFSLISTFFEQYFISIGIETHVYYESAVVIITLILLGNFLEERAKHATGGAIDKLMDLQAKTAIRVIGQDEETVPIEAVCIDDTLKVLPGAYIPVDGEVSAGSGYVDESMISGEPQAISKKQGDKVIGGTVNQNSVLYVKAKVVGEQTVLEQIIKAVQEAQGSKAPAQKLADKISSVFVPIVIGISIVSGLTWFFIGPEPAFIHAFVSSVTVLIIACPCALGLATPTAITVGVGLAAKNGILIKNAETLEKLHEVDTLFIDKTGTLTEGKPKVTQHVWSEKITQKQKAALFQAENNSEHPISKNICAFLQKEDLPKVELDDILTVAGQGVSFRYQGDEYFVGKTEWFNKIENGLAASLIQSSERINTTWVAFGKKDEILAVFGLEDQIKENAQESVAQLQRMNLKVIMLTGDNAKTAQYVAETLNLNGFHANQSPQNKAELVAEFSKNGNKCAMVGDGINDAPALANAHVGIAMSTGTDIAMESAGLTLLHGDINKIAKAISVSKSTVKTIKQNLFWAFIYNILAIPIAAGVLYPINGFLLNPMIAGGAMAFSSVTVVFNSLRLKFK